MQMPAVRLMQSKGRSAAAAIGLAGAVAMTQVAGAKSDQVRAWRRRIRLAEAVIGGSGVIQPNEHCLPFLYRP